MDFTQLLEGAKVLVFGHGEMMMGIGPLVAGLISAVAPSVINAIFGGGSSGGGASAANTEQQRQLGIQSGIETDVLGSQRDILDQLIALAGTFEGGPIGELDIGDNPFLDEAKLGALEPRRDIDLLRGLLNVNLGRGATGQAAELSQRQSEIDARAGQQQGSDIAGIISSLITLGGKGKPVVDTGSATDIFTNLLPDPTLDPFDTGSFGNRG